MALTPPTFWFRDSRTLPARLLSPLAAAWQAVGTWRQQHTVPVDCGIPVFCVGNVTLGGAGKTPVALDLASRLIAAGETVHFLTRGYGGSLKGPVLVDPAQHSAGDVGDEPLLLASTAPTWVSSDRVAGAKAARAAGAGLLIMDDGFQNPALLKTASILVIDGGVGIGNGQVFPAGPLREPWPAALARSHVVASLAPSGQEARLPEPGSAPQVRAHLIGTRPEALEQGTRCLAFAGIGRPEKFFQTARACGLDLIETQAFPDHHPFSASDLRALRERADRAQCVLVTTAKDHVRLPPDMADRVHIVGLSLEWVDGLSPFSILFGNSEHVD